MDDHRTAQDAKGLWKKKEKRKRKRKMTCAGIGAVYSNPSITINADFTAEKAFSLFLSLLIPDNFILQDTFREYLLFVFKRSL
eukprot:scaffold25190_cov53-Attheya_sp.AAC.1